MGCLGVSRGRREAGSHSGVCQGGSGRHSTESAPLVMSEHRLASSERQVFVRLASLAPSMHIQYGTLACPREHGRPAAAQHDGPEAPYTLPASRRAARCRHLPCPHKSHVNSILCSSFPESPHISFPPSGRLLPNHLSLCTPSPVPTAPSGHFGARAFSRTTPAVVPQGQAGAEDAPDLLILGSTVSGHVFCVDVSARI